ncbi:hypothetical protein FBZ94_10252 [Bradyrhizobium sacchari]|uniref:Uncharacterized protein n=1 Tax=Bradyrhizobium sacchari TaxID=1399419 RepID=A0A560IZR8_9BRAD|nr:hypothetical protein FBZ94_10252 [Bradyrhizobium sacchari]TWB80835.1 hypothetical protein FBZ95_10252 [Bradyrhizobium sacchari]
MEHPGLYVLAELDVETANALCIGGDMNEQDPRV